MTRGRWALLAVLIDGIWKDDFDATREASYYQLLAPFDEIDVWAAVLKLGERGGEWSPSAATLLKSIEPTCGEAPTFEALAEGLGSVLTAGNVLGGASAEFASRQLRQLNPLFELYARAVGLTRLTREALNSARDRETWLEPEWQRLLEPLKARRKVLTESPVWRQWLDENDPAEDESAGRQRRRRP